MSTTTDAGRWVPAPGSVARHTWPLPARWAWWLLHRPALAVLLAAAVAVAVLAGPVVLGVGLVVLVAVLVVWWRVRPAGFEAIAGRVLLGVWRSAWACGARWRTAMMLSGLGGRFENDEYLPRVVRVRAGRWADRVVVRIVAGQQPADWARRADALAHAFGARTCQVRETGRPGYLELRVGRRDPLAAVVPTLPVAEAVDLGALPIGRCEDGQPWTIRLAGAHLLIAGATGAGKGSVLWSLIRAVAPGGAGWAGAPVGARPQRRHGALRRRPAVPPVRLRLGRRPRHPLGRGRGGDERPRSASAGSDAQAQPVGG